MIPDEELAGIVHRLARRPGHEVVRVNLQTLLVRELGISDDDISQEAQTVQIRGRIDTLLGRTVFELKSNLQKELQDVERRLPDYLRDREHRSGQSFVGVATDGHTFIAYHLDRDRMREISRTAANVEHPRRLVDWLSDVVAVSEQLEPTPEKIRDVLGRTSPAWGVARDELAAIWDRLKATPEVKLKRDLWAGLIERVYGSPLGDDELFFQHTYLTAVAKTIACQALGLAVPEDAADLLSGQAFEDAGVHGVVESDFFDWPLTDPAGAALIKRIALHTARFRLERVQTDVLKGLYESLVDPQQRHELGEYYTPDWLAQRVVERAVTDPMQQRVLDPACGSGTFLFHAVRRARDAMRAAGKRPRQTVQYVTSQVMGVDIHPVAVQIARVTYLLAIGEDLLTAKSRGDISIPVYLGDSLQWNTQMMMFNRDVTISVPDGPVLKFPFSVAGDPATFDKVIQTMLALSAPDVDAGADAFEAALLSGDEDEPAPRIEPFDLRVLRETYSHLRDLQRAGRNHVWGYVARNQVRPVWLSQEAQRAHVVVGNPPWLSYRYMGKTTQAKFKEESEARGIWAGGKVATHQDLSALFFVKCMEQYLRPDGVIAFVLPYATMTRRQFEGLRQKGHGRYFAEAWVLSDEVQPLFPVPSCVLFARHSPTVTLGEKERAVLPSSVSVARGALPHRDASLDEADRALSWVEEPWPEQQGEGDGTLVTEQSVYAPLFKQGATMVPRMLCTVVEVGGPLGRNAAAPLVESRRTTQEKQPWKSQPALRGNVERQYLRPLLLGESIAPYRMLDSVLAVIPWDEQGQRQLDAAGAQAAGRRHLAAWLREAEARWSSSAPGKMTLIQQFDYFGKLSAQFPIAPLRVMFAASGTLPAAAVVRNTDAVAEHKLYWAPVETVGEANYLAAILNSETARERVQHLQSRGQWGARDFDKVMLTLPIPRFDRSVAVHAALATAGARAERLAAAVELAEGVKFVRARQHIRAALEVDGIAGEIDSLVADLLGPAR